METLALPSEMVAESVVNNIQTGGGRDNSVGDDELILQLVIALSVGEYTTRSRLQKKSNKINLNILFGEKINIQI